MKRPALYKTIVLAASFACLTGAAYAAKPTVLIQLNDPTDLCKTPMYIEYNYDAIASSQPSSSLHGHSNTPQLKSGDSYPVTLPNGIYDTFTGFNVVNPGNHCGELGWVAGGTCDKNQINKPLTNGTLVVQATPEKVLLTYGGYGYQLNCKTS